MNLPLASFFFLNGMNAMLLGMNFCSASGTLRSGTMPQLLLATLATTTRCCMAGLGTLDGSDGNHELNRCQIKYTPQDYDTQHASV